MQSQQLTTESQVLEDEVLPGAESADQPTEEMSERHDHGKESYPKNPNPAFRQVIHSAGVRRFGEAQLNALNLLSSPAGKLQLDSVLNEHMQHGGLDPALGTEIQIGRDRHFTDTMDMYVYARAESAKDVRNLLLREGDGAVEVLKRTMGSRTAYSVFGNHYQN